MMEKRSIHNPFTQPLEALKQQNRPNNKLKAVLSVGVVGFEPNTTKSFNIEGQQLSLLIGREAIQKFNNVQPIYTTYKVLSILVLIIAMSCSHLEEGEVVDKYYEPYRETMVMLPITVSTGKSTITTVVPYLIYDNEDYVLHVKGNHKGEMVTEKVYVSEHCYQSISKGDTWHKTDSCSYSDDNNVKIKQ